MNDNQTTSYHWWLGLAHIAAIGLEEGTRKVKRVHLAISDESFNILARIPVTRPVSEPVRFLHHGITRFWYGTLTGLAREASALTETRRD